MQDAFIPKMLTFTFSLFCLATNESLAPNALRTLLELLTATLTHTKVLALLASGAAMAQLPLAGVIDDLHTVVHGAALGMLAADAAAATRQFYDGDEEALQEAEMDANATRSSPLALSAVHRMCMLVARFPTNLAQNDAGFTITNGLTSKLSFRPLPEFLRSPCRAAVVAVSRVAFTDVHAYSLMCQSDSGQPSRLAASVLDDLMTPSGSEFRCSLVVTFLRDDLNFVFC
jgi:hypothetical protein